MELGTEYVEARPIIRGVIAFIIWLRTGEKITPEYPIGNFFSLADTWLSEFERRRS